MRQTARHMDRAYHAPLIWYESSYLLHEDTHSKFIDSLDGLLALSPEEIEAYGDLKRALLQRHLWAVFDWATARRFPASPDPEPKKLESARLRIQHKIASVMKRLALSKEQILALPDPMKMVVESKAYPPNHNPNDAYQPFFPTDLFDESGAWVCLRRHRDGLPAPLHSELEAWRSTFLVFMRLPGGRHATLDYLDKLNKFREPGDPQRRQPARRRMVDRGAQNKRLHVGRIGSALAESGVA